MVTSDRISVLVAIILLFAVTVVFANNCVDWASTIISPSVVEERVVVDLVASNINVDIAGEVVDWLDSECKLVKRWPFKKRDQLQDSSSC